MDRPLFTDHNNMAAAVERLDVLNAVEAEVGELDVYYPGFFASRVSVRGFQVEIASATLIWRFRDGKERLPLVIGCRHNLRSQQEP